MPAEIMGSRENSNARIGRSGTKERPVRVRNAKGCCVAPNLVSFNIDKSRDDDAVCSFWGGIIAMHLAS
jgi:hypothetical protein